MIYMSKIGKWLLKDASKGIYFGIFILFDPVFLTQSMIISPDIALIFFFLLSLYGILKRPHFNGYLLLGGLGLSMISLRGMMTLAALGVFAFSQKYFRKNYKQLIGFLPGIIMGFGFLILHSMHSQWIGYHATSPWAESFKFVNFKGFLKNIVVFVWRMLDEGRLFLYFGLLYIGLKSNFKWLKSSKVLVSLFLILGIFLLPTFLLYRGLNALRYLMPMMIVVNIIVLQSILSLKTNWKPLYLSLCLLLFLGNTWMYPKSISMSWDTTLRHLPYYSLRNNMIDYIQTSNIPFEKIGTAFPNMASFEIIDLNGIQQKMVGMDSPNAEYYFISNIMNDVKNRRKAIQQKCKLVKKFEKGGISVELYAFPSADSNSKNHN